MSGGIDWPALPLDTVAQCRLARMRKVENVARAKCCRPFLTELSFRDIVAPDFRAGDLTPRPRHLVAADRSGKN